MILRSDIRQEILDRPCPRCAKRVEEDGILSFVAGEFALYHDECFETEIKEMEQAVDDAYARTKSDQR